MEFFFGALFLSLPFSYLRIKFYSIPFYLPELMVTMIGALFLFRIRQKEDIQFSLDKTMLLGALFFLGGAALSFLTNPLSSAGLGILKAWFVFPMLAGVLLLARQRTNTAAPLLFWLLSSGFVALVSTLYLARHLLTYDGRLEAFFTSPNFLAITIAPGILLALAFFFLEDGEKFQPIFLFLISLLSLILFFTHSYSVWFALFLSLGCFLFLLKKEWNRTYMALLCIGVILTVGTFVLLESGSEKWHSLISLQERSSLQSRIMIWNASGKILHDSFPLGIGVGRFQAVYLEYQQYFPPYLEWAVPEPHNLYLAILLQTGVLGSLGFGMLLFGFFSSLRKVLSSSLALRDRAFAALLISLMVLYLVYGIFDTPYFKTDLAYCFWLLLALGVGFSHIKKTS